MTDDYSRHEILHMSSAIERLIERELAEHPAIMANPDWAGYVSRAATELSVLYQEIGAVHLSAPPEERVRGRLGGQREQGCLPRRGVSMEGSSGVRGGG